MYISVVKDYRTPGKPSSQALAKLESLIAELSTTRVVGLQETLMKRCSSLVADYFSSIKSIADDISFADAPPLEYQDGPPCLK